MPHVINKCGKSCLLMMFLCSIVQVIAVGWDSMDLSLVRRLWSNSLNDNLYLNLPTLLNRMANNVVFLWEANLHLRYSTNLHCLFSVRLSRYQDCEDEYVRMSLQTRGAFIIVDVYRRRRRRRDPFLGAGWRSEMIITKPPEAEPASSRSRSAKCESGWKHWANLNSVNSLSFVNNTVSFQKHWIILFVNQTLD